MNTLESPTKIHHEQLKTRPASPEELTEANEEFSKAVRIILAEGMDMNSNDETKSSAVTELAVERQALASQLLWEFDQVRVQCEDRAETVVNPDGTARVRFVFRDQQGTHADERFTLRTDQDGALLAGECITNFGNPQELLRRISVDENGFKVEQEIYDNGQSHWGEMDPKDTSSCLIALSSAMTHSTIKFIERSPDEKHQADESARAIVRRSMGLSALRASSTLE